MFDKPHDDRSQVRTEGDSTFDRLIELSIGKETRLAESPQISCPIANDLEFMRAIIRSDLSLRDLTLEAWAAERRRMGVVVGHA